VLFGIVVRLDRFGVVPPDRAQQIPREPAPGRCGAVKDFDHLRDHEERGEDDADRGDRRRGQYGRAGAGLDHLRGDQESCAAAQQTMVIGFALVVDLLRSLTTAQDGDWPPVSSQRRPLALPPLQAQVALFPRFGCDASDAA
jgi:hypothetical protein